MYILCFIRPIFYHCPLLFFLALMATARPTSGNSVPGSPMSILVVGHSFVQRLVGYLDDQHIDNFNLCDASYKVDFLASRVSTMPNLWENFTDILVKSPDVVYGKFVPTTSHVVVTQFFWLTMFSSSQTVCWRMA